jgi:hypothetical protein
LQDKKKIIDQFSYAIFSALKRVSAEKQNNQ